MNVDLEKLVSLCKRRGFLYQGSEIYGGLAGTWDFGPLGVQLKRNLINFWWQTFVEKRTDIYGLDSSILLHPQTWQASGHVQGFVDPLVEDVKTKERFRADTLLQDNGVKTTGLNLKQLTALIKKHQIKSPKGNSLSAPRQFNMMFKTQIGATTPAQTTYLRPETAQGIFINFKNIVDSLQPDLPFGVAQIGKAFRNEISPRDFVFRSREFEQLEIEYFCHPNQWSAVFDKLQSQLMDWFTSIGLQKDLIVLIDVAANERAHYSQKTIDFEFKFPFGQKELCGLAYRGDYDLKQHQTLSKKNLHYVDKTTNQKFLPVCIEPSLGVERLILALLQSTFRNDDEHQRTYLALPHFLAPIRYAVSPLVANKIELSQKARQVFALLQLKYGNVVWDDHGNIGKRYRRQDEVGTPYCLVIDFQTLKDNTVTRRDRDTLQQVRLKIDDL